jgi:hypothetical protein
MIAILRSGAEADIENLRKLRTCCSAAIAARLAEVGRRGKQITPAEIQQLQIVVDIGAFINCTLALPFLI